MSGLGAFIANQSSAEIKKALDLKAASITNIASSACAGNLLNFNFVELDRMVEGLLRDPDVSFAGVYNEHKELVTKNPETASTESLYVVERELKITDDSPVIGSLKIVYKADTISRSLRNSFITVAAGTVIAILLFSIGISVVANRVILKPVDRFSEVIRHIAAGDLSQTLDIVRDDELGLLAAALNEMVVNLNKMVGKVSRTADELNTIAGDLLGASGKVVNTAKLQAEGVNTTSSAIIQINASTKGVSESVNGLSLSATESSSSIL